MWPSHSLEKRGLEKNTRPDPSCRQQTAIASFALLDCRVLPPDRQRAELLDISRITTQGEHLTEEDARGRMLDESAGGTLVIVGVAQLAVDLQELLVRSVDQASPPLWRLIATEREPLKSLG